ncbi:MAG: carbon-nitrogen hydrolase family protein [Pirellula sp.]
MGNLQIPVAGVQMDIQIGDANKNVERMAGWLQDDRTQSARLVVFPECAVSGYCFESKAEGMGVAETIPGPSTSRLLDLAKKHDKFLAFGMIERSGDDLYNSCVLLGPNGIVGVYRKIHLPFLGIDRFATAGTAEMEVYEVAGMRVGMHICYDASFPELTRVLALQGADLILLPTNWPPGAETFAEYAPNTRALENHVYFMAVSRVGEERGFRFLGTSKFCLPTGRSPSFGGTDQECVVGGSVQPHIARNKRLVRVPGKHMIDRFADRRPSHYGKLIEPHHLVRDESDSNP